MKEMMKKAAAAICAAAMVLSLASCGGGKVTDEEIEDIADDISSVVDDMGGDSISDGGSAPAGVSTNIEFGDFEGFKKLNDSIDSMAGQTVTIDGIFDRSGFSGYSIGQKNGDDFVGRRFHVEGFSEGDYPEFGSRVKLTGTIVYDEESWVSEIVVQPGDFEPIS